MLFRSGIIKGPHSVFATVTEKSNAPKSDYFGYRWEQPVKTNMNARLAKASLSRIIIERTLKLVTITVCTARPGLIIGKGGQEVDKLKEELKKITDKDVQINIFEVKRPDLDAVIVANNIARQVEGKIAYRRAVKMAIASTMRMGAEGIKCCSIIMNYC